MIVTFLWMKWRNTIVVAGATLIIADASGLVGGVTKQKKRK